MLAVALLLATATLPSSFRAELVEAPLRTSPGTHEKYGPSTSSEQTEAGSALNAERAFAAAAQKDGQWTAFRKWAAPEAIMFVPKQVKAHDWLKSRRDPVKSVRWQPTRAWTSCDGTLAVTTGNWQRGKAVGYFTTVWRRERGGGWTWVLDSGDVLKVARPANDRPAVIKAACRASTGADDAIFFGGMTAGGNSDDGTLGWFVERTEHRSRVVHVRLRRERDTDDVIYDESFCER